MSGVDVLGRSGVQCALAQSLGCVMWPMYMVNLPIYMGKSLCHAPEHPPCKTVGRVIPYQGVVRIIYYPQDFFIAAGLSHL